MFPFMHKIDIICMQNVERGELYNLSLQSLLIYLIDRRLCSVHYRRVGCESFSIIYKSLKLFKDVLDLLALCCAVIVG
jgi:hypothetical protein